MEIRHADLQIEVEEAQDAPAHPVGRHSGQRGVLGYDEEVWGDEGNRRRLLGALGAHADELRVWARDAGVTLPGPEPDAPAGESGTSSYGI